MKWRIFISGIIFCSLMIGSAISQAENIAVYKTTLLKRPPFYKGEMPLIYKVGKTPGGGTMYGMPSIIYWHDFGSWQNKFFYSSETLVINSAHAIDTKGHLLAKAEFLNVDRASHTMKFREVHYESNGSVKFSCISTFSSGMNEKIREENATGKKGQEYFFLLPISSY